MKTEIVWTSPCLTGWETSAVAPAFGAEPIPASFENKPLFIPYITQEPLNPPIIALKSNAWLNISAKIVGSLSILVSVIYSPINIYKTAIMGTTVELIIPIRCTPPKITNAVIKAKIIPIIILTTWLFSK